MGIAGSALLHYLICLAYLSLSTRDPVTSGPGCPGGHHSHVPVSRPKNKTILPPKYKNLFKF